MHNLYLTILLLFSSLLSVEGQHHARAAIDPTPAGEIGVAGITAVPISEMRGSIGVNTRMSLPG